VNIRINRFQTVIAGALVCATSLGSGTAQALSCAVFWSEAPVEGAQGVPTNTLIWGYGRSAENHMQLVGPQGSVPLRELFLPVVAYSTVTHYPVLEPLEDLEPGASYWLEWSYPGVEPGELSRVSFTTGAGPWTMPPPVPELIATEADVGSTWFGSVSRAVQLDFEHQGFLVGDADGALGDVSSLADLLLTADEIGDDPYAEQPLNEASRAASVLTTAQSVWMGFGDCLSWPLSGHDQHQARFGSLDLAGNFSGFLPPTEVALVPQAEAQALVDRQTAEQGAEEADLAEARNERLRQSRDGRQASAGCGIAPWRAHRRGDFWAALAVGSAISLFRRRRRPQT
jgi:hypothetical protein